MSTSARGARKCARASTSRFRRSASLPTPGHSPGHQSVAVETDAGLLVLAGQVFRDASGFARAVTAYRLRPRATRTPPPYPEWLPRMLELEPYRVAFGHDLAIWQPDA